jgi:hypothetical protein
MGLWKRIRSAIETKSAPTAKGRGLLLFNEVGEAMTAERILIEAGHEVKGVAPPLEVRKGCDLAVEFNLVDQLGIERILRDKELTPLDIVSLDNLSRRPEEFTRKKDFGDYLMVTAANMKLTFEKKSLNIVNISGGGCPDVPYLTISMVGKTLAEAEDPGNLGYSLCAYMLKKAFEKSLELAGLDGRKP